MTSVISTIDGHEFKVSPCCEQACKDLEWMMGEDGYVVCCQNPLMKVHD